MRYFKKQRVSRTVRQLDIQSLEDRWLLTAASAEVPVGASVQVCYAETRVATDSQALSTADAQVTRTEQGTSGKGHGGQNSQKGGVSVAPVNPRSTGPRTTEKGGMEEFKVVLEKQPTADVTINLYSNNADEGIVDKSSLSFTAADWDTPQIITVTGVDDANTDGNVAYMLILEPAISNDPTYAGLDPADTELTNIDDETPVTNAIYVRSFALYDSRERGPNTDYRFILDVGIAGSGADAAGVQVVVSVYQDDGSGDTDLNNELNIRNFLGTTESDGTLVTPWLRGPAPGNYRVEVHDLFFDGYLWDPLDELDAGTDHDGDGRPDIPLIV